MTPRFFGLNNHRMELLTEEEISSGHVKSGCVLDTPVQLVNRQFITGATASEDSFILGKRIGKYQHRSDIKNHEPGHDHKRSKCR